MLFYIYKAATMYRKDYEREVLAVQKQLHIYAKRLTHDAERADDLLQDTTLRILNNAGNYDERNSFSSWAFVIMRNIFLNNERSANSRSRAFIMGYDDADDCYFETSVADSESDYYGNELQSLIDSLPQELSLLLRRRIEGYKYEEIAAETGLPIGTVKSQLFVAKKRLKILLEQG